MKFGQTPRKAWHSTQELGGAFNGLNRTLNRLMVLDHVWARLTGVRGQFWRLQGVKGGTLYVKALLAGCHADNLYDYILNLCCALIIGTIILIHIGSNLGSSITAGIGMPFVSEGSAVNIMLAALTAVHVARKLQKQLHNRGKTRHQVSVLRDQPLDNGFDLRIGRAQVLRLAQRQVLEGQIVLHIEIAVHLLKADFEHMHRSAPGADVVGVERIGRNDKQLLPLQGEPLVVNHNFTTQIFTQQQLDRVGIVQRHDVLHLKLLDADGIGHLRRKEKALLEPIGQAVSIVDTLHSCIFPHRFLL